MLENTAYTSSVTSVPDSRRDFLAKTYQLFGGSIIAGAAGAYLAIPYASSFGMIGLFVMLAIEIGLIFAIQAKQNTSMGLPLLFIFGLISGATLAPLLALVMTKATGASLIGEAFLMTSIIFFGLSYYALTTKKNLNTRAFGQVLLWGLVALIIGSVINIFVGNSFASLIMAWIGALLFSGFILYDTQAIAKGEYETPVSAALSLYLNFINLFSSILRIISSSDE